MRTLYNVLRFRIFLAPYLLEILFWAGIGGVMYGVYWLYTHDVWAWWLALLCGPIMVRLIFEFALLTFQTYKRLSQIYELLQNRD